MKQNSSKKVNFTRTNIAWGATALIVICLSILFYLLLTKMPEISYGLSKITGVVMPVIMGCAIAYILLPLYNAMFVRLRKLFSKKISPLHAVRLAKGLSTFLSLAILVTVVVVLLVMAIPQVIDSIINIANSMPDNISKLTKLNQKLLKDNPEIYNAAVNALNQFQGGFTNMVKEYVLPYTSDFITGITTGVINILGFMFNILIGLIVCVYILVSKETFCAQAKKLIYAKFHAESANRIMDDARSIHRIFSGFISGKILDSLIIGLVTMVALSIMNMPYAVMISVIVGVTNIIPFFGPFIGAIPSALIILTSDPIKSLYFLIYIMIIQQIDGNILGPKILGNSTGLPSFWVLFAILLCGGLFGVAGMILGVPVFAVIYFFVGRWINESLQEKGYDSDTRLYYGLKDVCMIDSVPVMNYIEGDTYTAQHGEADAVKRNIDIREIIHIIKDKKRKNDVGESVDDMNENPEKSFDNKDSDKK